ncbi:hypothetical protein GW750_03985 [bacterium]|nr:hypothetical protein [bacterium]
MEETATTSLHSISWTGRFSIIPQSTNVSPSRSTGEKIVGILIDALIASKTDQDEKITFSPLVISAATILRGIFRSEKLISQKVLSKKLIIFLPHTSHCNKFVSKSHIILVSHASFSTSETSIHVAIHVPIIAHILVHAISIGLYHSSFILFQTPIWIRLLAAPQPNTNQKLFFTIFLSIFYICQ